MVVLALGVAVLPWLWRPVRPLLCIAVAVPAGAAVLVGVVTWRAGLTREVVSGEVLPLILVWSFGLPLALAAAVAFSIDGRTPRRTTRWRVAVAVLVSAATPLVEVMFGPLLVGYWSHDSTPWTGAVSGALLVVAACAAWPATSGAREPTTTQQKRVEATRLSTPS